MRYLIINADDFGISAGVNEGIVDAWKAGVITSTSIMPTGLAYDDAIAKAKEIPGLPIGVHFSVSSGRCCASPTNVASLTDATGAFLIREGESFREQMALASRISAQELEVELRAQFEAILSAGFRPQHVDCHHAYLYAVPELYSVVLRLAAEWRVVARFPFGDNVENAIGEMAAAYSVKPEAILLLSNVARNAKKKFGTSTPDRYFQIHTRWDKEEKRIYLQRLIENLPEGVSELCFHPGKGTQEREDDLEIVMATEFASKVEECGVVIHNPLVEV